MPPPDAFILALDRVHANTTMRVDLLWPPYGLQGQCQSNWGERVHHLTRPEQIAGRRGMRVYLGYGYFDRPDWQDWETLFRAFECDLVDVSAPAARIRAWRGSRVS